MAIYTECHSLCGRALEGCKRALYGDSDADSTAEFVTRFTGASTLAMSELNENEC
ncbi:MULTISPECIES: hypothetical protein [unclassified Pseudomonas]|uniref:hypothetical protein n=1 Tax=unclassified Pseudomonas TaxID=196821 RepID=UPI0039E0E152